MLYGHSGRMHEHLSRSFNGSLSCFRHPLLLGPRQQETVTLAYASGDGQSPHLYPSDGSLQYNRQPDIPYPQSFIHSSSLIFSSPSSLVGDSHSTTFILFLQPTESHTFNGAVLDTFVCVL